MYVRPGTAAMRTTPSASKSILPAIGPLICGGLVLFLLAGAIILALIPIYLPQRSVTPNLSSLRSKESTMTVEVEKSHATQGRRRRATGDLTEYVGGSFTPEALEKMKSLILPKLPKKTVDDIIILEVLIANLQEKRKKRFLLKKRQSSTSKPVILVIKFIIVYKSHCTPACQSANEPELRSKLGELSNEDIVLENVPIILNGQVFIVSRIQFIDVLYVSEIISSTNSETPGTAPPFILVTEPTVPTVGPSPTPAIGG